MTTEIKVPTLGESVSEATVGKWFKKEGDAVVQDEPLVELETDKVTVEVPAPSSGRLESISVKDGETVEVGALLGMLGEGAGKPADSGKAEAIDAGPEELQERPNARKGDGKKAKKSDAAPVDSGDDAEASEADSDMPPAPAARKLMEEKGVSAAEVSGSGKRGQVLKGDVLEALERTSSAPADQAAAPRAPVAAGDEAREQRVKMTKLRQTIARRLKEAQNQAAMLTTFNDVDMGAVMDLRKTYKDLFEKKHGVRLGFMGFFVKACVQALRDVPAVNAEIDGQDLIYKNFYHIGVAVGTEKGLVVPVLREHAGHVVRRRREVDQRLRPARPGRPAEDGGDAGRHLHDLQWRRLRLADVDADPQRAAIGHSRHASHRGAPGGARRPGRGAADDVSGSLLRSPGDRREGGRDLPGAGQGRNRGSAAADPRPLGENAPEAVFRRSRG